MRDLARVSAARMPAHASKARWACVLGGSAIVGLFFGLAIATWQFGPGVSTDADAQIVRITLRAPTPAPGFSSL